MPQTCFLSILAIGLAALPLQNAWTAEASVRVKTLDGQDSTGSVVEWTGGEITISQDSEKRSFSSDDLLRIDWRSDQRSTDNPRDFISLVDETRFPIDDIRVADRQATIETPLSATPLSIGTKKIHTVEFSSDARSRSSLQRRLEESQPSGDLLVVRKKQGSPLEFLSGITGDIVDDRVHFTWDGEAIPVKRSKVAAVVYYHARAPEHPAPLCRLETVEGALITAVNVKLSEGLAEVTTAGGLQLSIPVGTITTADFSMGKLAYLSDLKPLRQKWTPLIALPKSASLIREYGTPRRDQSFDGSIISLAWDEEKGGTKKITTHGKGLAVRSRTEMEYRIPAGMNRFVALAGIDPAAAGQGSVQLEIFADDQIVWQGEILGRSPPEELACDIADARRLRIVVDYGENLDYGDRLHLAEARVTQ